MLVKFSTLANGVFIEDNGTAERKPSEPAAPAAAPATPSLSAVSTKPASPETPDGPDEPPKKGGRPTLTRIK